MESERFAISLQVMIILPLLLRLLHNPGTLGERHSNTDTDGPVCSLRL